jgi:hypothetical protein
MQERSILYAAVSELTSLAEVFQQARLVNRSHRQPWLVWFSLVRDVPLLDLAGTWPTAAGASMLISSGPRSRAQRWSRAIYDAYPDLQGIWYPSSMHANQPAVALFDRAESSVADRPDLHLSLTDVRLNATMKDAVALLGYRIK